jgi:hypothetical protein
MKPFHANGMWMLVFYTSGQNRLVVCRSSDKFSTANGRKGGACMEKIAAHLEMGTIFCKHCERVIATFDAEKITNYYSDCQDKECLKSRNRKQSEETQKSNR